MANWEELWPKRARKEKWRSITSQRRHNSWPMSQNAIRFSLNDAIEWFNLINIWPKPPSFLDKDQKGDVVSNQMQNISCQTQQSRRFTSRRFDYAPLNRQYQKIPGDPKGHRLKSSATRGYVAALRESLYKDWKTGSSSLQQSRYDADDQRNKLLVSSMSKCAQKLGINLTQHTNGAIFLIQEQLIPFWSLSLNRQTLRSLMYICTASAILIPNCIFRELFSR